MVLSNPRRKNYAETSIHTTEPTVVLKQPPPPHHFSFVKGEKWFGGKYFNRNYLGKGIRRVEKDFLVV